MTERRGRQTGRGRQTPAHDVARSDFRRLLAANPNHFGNFPESGFKPVQPISNNTTYEDLTCVGLNPALNLLEATVQVKRPNGFLGDLCSPGSTEYVRFYLDYGAGWEDAGWAAFTAHDIPNFTDCAKQPDKPLSYVVTLPIQPQTNWCGNPVLPNVRAILSWNMQPPANSPNWLPVWGNVKNQHVQIKPRPLFLGDVSKLLAEEAIAKLPPMLQEADYEPIPLPDPPPLEIAELSRLYADKGETAAGGTVPPHRFGFADLQAAMTAFSLQQQTSTIQAWQKADLDLAAALAALEQTQGDVTYEELECLGLDYNAERLIATFRIKRPSGYSGNLCGLGSKEYVSFWVDWNNTCQWTYLDTVEVNVHDITSIPADGLAYSAVLPVDLSAIRQPCGGQGGGPKIGRVRAVLSWNTPPSTTDPNALPYWGNRVEAHVQIKPGEPVGIGPVISIIGGIGVDDIDIIASGLTKPTATFALGGSPADPWGLSRACPFGSLVIVQGPPFVGHNYRLMVRPFGSMTSGTPVTNPIHVVNWLGIGSWRTPDPMTGYLSYISPMANIDQVLAHWTPSGDDKWEIGLELDGMGVAKWHTIQLDNTAPRRRPANPPYEPPEVTCDIHIDSGGDCKDFTQGTKIDGHFVARDANFGSWYLSTTPSSLSPPAPTSGGVSSGTNQTATFVAGGDAWTLDTKNMEPCGYVIRVEVYDRSIVNSQPGSHNSNYADVGFCLRAK